MIRYKFIQNEVLKIYRSLPQLNFPLNVDAIINSFPNIKLMTYAQFSELNQCTIDDVEKMCQSKSGCTHYDISTNRYLMLINSTEINEGRKRWTKAHELGHIICGHMNLSNIKLAENSNNKNDLESEADYFAATLLSPFPIIKEFDLVFPFEIKNSFGLSEQASIIRHKQFCKWNRSHYKTAWENDIIKLYHSSNLS